MFYNNNNLLLNYTDTVVFIIIIIMCLRSSVLKIRSRKYTRHVLSPWFCSKTVARLCDSLYITI